MQNIRGGTGTGNTELNTVFATAPSITGGMNLSSGAPTGTNLNYVVQPNAEAVVQVTITATDRADAMLYGTPSTTATAEVYLVIRDRVAPRIMSFTPTRTATIGSTLDLLILQFDEEVDRPTVDQDSIRIDYIDRDNAAQELIYSTNDNRLTFSASQVLLSISPTLQLAKNTTVSIRIDDEAFRDVAGQNTSIPGAAANSFSSATPTVAMTMNSELLTFWVLRVANAPPVLRSTSPLEGARNVSARPKIEFNFDENISLTTGSMMLTMPVVSILIKPVVTGAFPSEARTISSAGSVNPMENATFAISDNTLTVTLLEDLRGNADVTLTVPAGLLTGSSSAAVTTSPVLLNFFTSILPQFDPASSFPVPSATMVLSSDVRNTILAAYTEPILKGNAGAVHVFARKAGAALPYIEVYTFLANSDRLSIKSTGLGRDSTLEVSLPNLSSNTEYRITIDEGVVVYNGPGRSPAAAVAGSAWEFSTESTIFVSRLMAAELVRPTATNAPIDNDTIVISFNRPIEKAIPADIIMYILIDGEGYPFATISTDVLADSRSQFEVNPTSFPGFLSGRFVHIKYPGGSLPYGATFYLLVGGDAFQDYSGSSNSASVAVTDDAQWRFTTTAIGDNQGPRIVAAVIPNGNVSDANYNMNITASKSNASRRPRIRLTFDEALQNTPPPLPPLTEAVMLRQGTSCTSGATAATIRREDVRISGSVVTISMPTGPELDYNTNYTLQIPVGRFTDTEAMPNDSEEICYTFRTRLAPPDFVNGTVVVEFSVATLTDPAVPDPTVSPFMPQSSFTSSTYNDIRWGWQESRASLSSFTPNSSNSTRPTYGELASATSSTTSSSFDFNASGELDSADIGVYTYMVWNGDANNQISDTTKLLLVILDTDEIEIRTESVDPDRDNMDPGNLLRSSTPDTYNMSFPYDGLLILEMVMVSEVPLFSGLRMG